MKSFVYFATAAAISAFGMGCGGGGKPMPSAEQKTQLTSVEASVNRAEGVIPTSDQTQNTIAFVSTAMRMRFLGQADTSSGADTTRLNMQNRLQDSVSSGDCKVVNSGLSGNIGDVDLNHIVNGSIVVSGDNCPVDLKFSVQGGTGNSMTSTVTYNVKDTVYRALNDVDSFSVTADSRFSTASGSGSISATYNATFHSQKYGAVSETGVATESLDGNSMRVDVKVTDSFPTFQITREAGSSLSQGSANNQYFKINGNDVSSGEFNSYGDPATPLRLN